MSSLRRAGWGAVFALVVLTSWWAERPQGVAAPWILRPVAELAAELQWLRFQKAVRAGAIPRALEFAESALALSPRATDGWQRLGAYLVFDLASREREPDLERRRAWFEAGRELLARGRVAASEPGELDLLDALVALAKAEGDPELHPGGRPALLREAAAAFERATAAGIERARGLADQVRAEAAAE